MTFVQIVRNWKYIQYAKLHPLLHVYLGQFSCYEGDAVVVNATLMTTYVLRGVVVMWEVEKGAKMTTEGVDVFVDDDEL